MSLPRVDNAVLFEHLASRGYVVEHPLEMIGNSIIGSLFVYTLPGLDLHGGAVLLSAVRQEGSSTTRM